MIDDDGGGNDDDDGIQWAFLKFATTSSNFPFLEKCEMSPKTRLLSHCFFPTSFQPCIFLIFFAGFLCEPQTTCFFL